MDVEGHPAAKQSDGVTAEARWARRWQDLQSAQSESDESFQKQLPSSFSKAQQRLAEHDWGRSEGH